MIWRWHWRWKSWRKLNILSFLSLDLFKLLHVQLLVLILLHLLMPSIWCCYHVMFIIWNWWSMIAKHRLKLTRLPRLILNLLVLRHWILLLLISIADCKIRLNVILSIGWLLVLLLFLLLHDHNFFHLLDWNGTLYIYPFVLDNMLILKSQNKIDTSNVNKSDKSKTTRLVCSLIL